MHTYVYMRISVDFEIFLGEKKTFLFFPIFCLIAQDSKEWRQVQENSFICYLREDIFTCHQKNRNVWRSSHNLLGALVFLSIKRDDIYGILIDTRMNIDIPWTANCSSGNNFYSLKKFTWRCRKGVLAKDSQMGMQDNFYFGYELLSFCYK